MKERLVIVFIALILGLLITTAGFFIYQSAKALPNDKPQEKEAVAQASSPVQTPTPTPPSGLFLTIDTPTDESLFDKRTIDIKGKTNPDNLVIISSNQEDIEAKPTSNGSFSTTIIIDAGANKIITRAISPDGNEATDERVVTYSSEDF